jgi:hypothetical protein
MKRFNSDTVKPSSHLVRNERVRLASQKEAKRIVRWAEEAPTYVKVREYLAPVTIGFKPRGFKRRNNPVIGISDAKFAAVTAVRSAIGKNIHRV